MNSTSDTACTITIRCPYPECAGRAPQSATLNKARLKEMLDAGEVRVGGIVCGHFWNLSKQEIDNAQKMLDKGLL